MSSSSLSWRRANPHDAPAVAAVHTESWRNHYRGALSDDFLDHRAAAELLDRWTADLADTTPTLVTWLAEVDSHIVGFARTVIDEDPTWGSCLKNLHVVKDCQGLGVGTRLMALLARDVIEKATTNRLYLWVLEQNTAAQEFYEVRGGRCVERGTGCPFPDGSTPPVLRFAWDDASPLLV